eukprot:scaffold1402_cov254-Pinguiococcus_pyrenoidosus.AAC.31
MVEARQHNQPKDSTHSRSPKQNTWVPRQIQQYKTKIEDELLTICEEILRIITDNLIPATQSDEGKVRAPLVPL